ncbi:MAG: hypothetical protein WBA87_00105 [Microbacterium sp.]
MRADLALGAAATAVAITLLSGCSPASASSLTVHRDGGEEQTISIPDLQCVTSGDKFSASSSQARVGELSAFTATAPAGADEAITWVSLGDDQWFLTTDAFEHDGAVAFDHAEGRIGTSAQGYPTDFDATGTISGELTCTTQKSL